MSFEQRIERKSKEWGLKQISTMVIDNCNAKCLQCFVWKREPRPAFTPEEMGKMLANSDISKLTSFSISGGEPTLRNDLRDILLTIREYFGGHLVVQSNCFMKPRLIRAVKNIDKLTVCCSLDGVGELHSTLRGMPGGYEMVIDTMETLKKEDIDFLVSFTVQAANQHQLFDVFEVAKRFDVPFWTRPAGTGHLFNKYDQTPLDTKRLIADLEKIKEINPVWISADIDYLKQGHLPFPCTAGLNSVLIAPNFDVFPCSHCSETWLLGNIRDVNYNLSELLTRKFSEHCRKCINEIAHPFIAYEKYGFMQSEVPKLMAKPPGYFLKGLIHPIKAAARKKSLSRPLATNAFGRPGYFRPSKRLRHAECPEAIERTRGNHPHRRRQPQTRVRGRRQVAPEPG